MTPWWNLLKVKSVMCKTNFYKLRLKENKLFSYYFLNTSVKTLVGIILMFAYLANLSVQLVIYLWCLQLTLGAI